MEFYKEYPLESPDSIRVLTLHPGGSDAPLEASMMTVQLSSKPKFVALSYTWGNPVDEGLDGYQEYDLVKYYISCAGQRLPVQQNLHDALWRLRERQHFLPLWIDSICIDQGNKSELKLMLSLMSRLYFEALSVIIWLGKEDATTDDAVRYVNALERSDSLITKLFTCRGTDERLLKDIPQQTQHAISLLLRRRWFNRVWTLQEVLLPQRTTCLCGSYELDVGNICLLASLWLGLPAEDRVVGSVPTNSDESVICHLGGAACVAAWIGLTWPSGGFGERAFFRYPKIDIKLEIPPTAKWLVALELLVHESRQRNCTNPKDKILAPLAFALHEAFTPKSPSFQSLEEEARGLLDCRSPTAVLYVKFTRFMIRTMESLDILSRVHQIGQRSPAAEELGLPSWVPPFHKSGTISLIDDLLFTRYNAAIYMGPFDDHERGNATKLSELPVRAVFFGRIIQISTHAAPVDTIPEWFSHVHNSESYKQEVVSANSHDLVHAVTRYLGDRIAQGIEWVTKQRENRHEFCRFHLCAVSMINLNVPVSQKAMRRLYRFDICGKRLIGLAPNLARESDDICILQGAKVPFILRETPGTGKYALVGETFMENFMHGEIQNLGFPSREITLV